METEIVKAKQPFEITRDFIEESNRIEGIDRPALEREIEEHERFMKLNEITVDDVSQFVRIFEPGAVIRTTQGQNVTVGGHVPPPGGPRIHTALGGILSMTGGRANPFYIHCFFEDLHPFTDCNGRSGRMVWLWQMREAPLGFLHTFYYQSLIASRPDINRAMYSLEGLE